MSRRSLRERTLALGGVFHGCALAHQVAATGQITEQALQRAVDTVLDTNAPTVEAVYGQPGHIGEGLNCIVNMRGSGNAYINRYVIGVMTLERILRKKPETNEQLAAGIAKAGEQAEYFGSSGHESVVGALAELYRTLISPIGPRIMVNGEAVYLENPRHANQIRALLLVSLRSAVLWRQIGGSRLSLIFGYRKVVAEAESLLREPLIDQT